MRCKRRWTRVQGWPEAILHRNLSGAPQGWVLVRVSCADFPRPPGHLGTAAHLGWGWHCITYECTDSGASGLTFEPAVPRVNSGKSSTYGTIVDRRIIGGKGRTGAPRQRPEVTATQMPAVTKLTPAAPQVRHLRVDESSAGQRLDNFLLRTLKGVPKTHVYRVIRSGEVRVNKGRAAADTRVQTGDDVRVPPVRMAERPAAATVPARDFRVLFEDEVVLAIDKPAGVAVHGGSGVSFGVIEQLRQARPTARFLELVHRLDRETSGVLLLAKKRSALTALQDQFRARDTGKTYAALVLGAWPDTLKVIDVPLHKYLKADGERRVRASTADDTMAKRSITLVKVVQRFAGFTLLDVGIKTGRTHQIRVHLAHSGHAIVGDEKYGDFEFNKSLARGSALPGQRYDGMFLHARCLAFDHPASGERIELEAPLPAACSALLRQLPALA
jgi:23S rRNA pseudouridine955/2504/2580 synthase